MSYFSPPRPKVFVAPSEEVVDSLKFAFHKAQELLDGGKLERFKKLIIGMLSNEQEDMVYKILTNLQMEQSPKFEEFSFKTLDKLTKPEEEKKTMHMTLLNCIMVLVAGRADCSWRGHATDLLGELWQIPEFKAWRGKPKAGNALTRMIKDIHQDLMCKGIEIEWTREAGDRYIHLYTIDPCDERNDSMKQTITFKTSKKERIMTGDRATRWTFTTLSRAIAQSNGINRQSGGAQVKVTPIPSDNPNIYYYGFEIEGEVITRGPVGEAGAAFNAMLVTQKHERKMAEIRRECDEMDEYVEENQCEEEMQQLRNKIQMLEGDIIQLRREKEDLNNRNGRLAGENKHFKEAAATWAHRADEELAKRNKGDALLMTIATAMRDSGIFKALRTNSQPGDHNKF